MTQNGFPSGSASTTHGTSPLADVEVACPEPERPLDDLGLPLAAGEVEVQPGVGRRRLGDALEAQVERRGRRARTFASRRRPARR